MEAHRGRPFVLGIYDASYWQRGSVRPPEYHVVRIFLLPFFGDRSWLLDWLLKERIFCHVLLEIRRCSSAEWTEPGAESPDETESWTNAPVVLDYEKGTLGKFRTARLSW